MSEAIPLQTTLEDNIRLVALVPGWANECKAKKTVFLSCVGITGLAAPLETSQSTETSPNITGCTIKEEDDNVLTVSAQADWWAAIRR
jgi:hypothetical protein